jgi:hypothetical protein
MVNQAEVTERRIEVLNNRLSDLLKKDIDDTAANEEYSSVKDEIEWLEKCLGK